MENVEIKYSHFRDFFQRTGYWLKSFYVWLGLKNEKKFWGVVYDAKTKEPLDPVILKLVSATDKLELQTCITDLKGRYGFLAYPGKYKILAMRTNYIFPSKIVVGDSDGSFKNLYHGEFFQIAGDSEVVAPNIPMDPVSDDWNQKAKRKMFSSFRQKIFSLVSFLGVLGFWLGFIFVSSRVYWEVSSTGLVKFSWAVDILCVYILLFLFSFIVPVGRLWGQVLSAETKTPLTNMQIDLINPIIKGSVMAKTVVWEDGKFFLRTNPGIYELVFKTTETNGTVVELGRVMITVGPRSLINHTFYIKY